MSANVVDKPNTFSIDDREVDIRDGETIFRAARRLDIKLPHLCYSPKPGYRPDGNCRVCMVEVEGERVLAASCIRTPTPGMKVRTDTERAKAARKMVAELLLADQPARATSHDPESEFWKTVTRQGVETSRFPRRAALASEASGQRGDSMVRAHSASEDARERAGDTRPQLGSSARAAPAPDRSHPAMAVNLDACI